MSAAQEREPKPTSRLLSALTVAFSYVTWFLTVGGAARGHPWLAALAQLFMSVWIVALWPSAGRAGLTRHTLVRLALLTALVGFSFDTTLSLLGVVSLVGEPSLVGGARLGLTSPLWLVGLWVSFGLLLITQLQGLLRRPWLAALLGAVGGTSSYAGGAKLGAMSWLWPASEALTLIALSWALVMGLSALLFTRSPLSR